MEDLQSYRIASTVPQNLLLQVTSSTCSSFRLTVQLDKHLRTSLILADDAASSPVSRHNRPSLDVLNVYTLKSQRSDMDSLAASMPERLGRPREPLPNLRGEDETEIRYLIDLIESK